MRAFAVKRNHLAIFFFPCIDAPGGVSLRWRHSRHKLVYG